MNKSQEEMPFEVNILKDRVQALYNGAVYYEMLSLHPDIELLLLQTRIMTYHPLRNKDSKCIHYLVKESVNGEYIIKNCNLEKDVEEHCRLAHNWLLNNHEKEDEKRKISPFI